MDLDESNLISSVDLEDDQLVYFEGFCDPLHETNTSSEPFDESSESTSQLYYLDNLHSDTEYEIQNPGSSLNPNVSLSLYEYEEDSDSNNEDNSNNNSLVSQPSSTLQHDSDQELQQLNQSPFESDNEEQQEQEEIFNIIQKSRKRKKKANPDEWTRNINKKKRALGQNYERKVQVSTDQGEELQIVTVPGREIGLTCNSKRCKKRRQCAQFSENDRKKIFDNFWEMDWNKKKIFVCSSVDIEEPKKRAEVRSYDRDNSMIYYLKLNDSRKRVCRQMFLSTLGLKKSQVYNWLNKIDSSVSARPNKNTTNTSSRLVMRRNFLNNFFNRLQKCESHYCRKDSTKIYLEPIVKSKSQLMKLYTEECKKEKIKPFSRGKFEKMFTKLNLSLFKSKKDLCNTCIQYELKHVSQDRYNSHQKRKTDARNEKKLDKNLAKAGTCYTLSMDLQQVKLCPNVQANASFFKQKLTCHNFTIYNLHTRHSTCFWWTEIDADSTASNFASCIIDYLNNHCLNPLLPIIIFSDGCGYQNRNAMLSSALLSFSVQNNVNITQKYLEPGHTQMEVDSVHSTIERKLKNENVYLPSDYSNFTRTARSTGTPYEVKEVQFNFFSNFSDKSKMVYPSIRPGKEKVNDIRVLRYSPDGTISFKLNYLDDYKQMPHKSSLSPPIHFPPLYSEPIKITDKKYSDLQDLKEVIPSEFHKFYDDLPRGKIQKKKK